MHFTRLKSRPPSSPHIITRAQILSCTLPHRASHTYARSTLHPRTHTHITHVHAPMHTPAPNPTRRTTTPTAYLIPHPDHITPTPTPTIKSTHPFPGPRHSHTTQGTQMPHPNDTHAPTHRLHTTHMHARASIKFYAPTHLYNSIRATNNAGGADLASLVGAVIHR